MSAEITLGYTNGRWRAHGLGIDVEHVDLRSLEELVAASLASIAPASVVMRFDPSSLPQWLRQYQAHYFNYTLRLPPSSNSTLSLAPRGDEASLLAPPGPAAAGLTPRGHRA